MAQQDFLLDKISPQQNPLKHAVAMQKKASDVGFDWTEIEGVLAKIHEELDELQSEITAGSAKQRLEDELGDVLFACCNLARHLDVDPITALNSTNQKFYRRFNFVEHCVNSQKKQFQDFSLQELDAFWEQAKMSEI